MFVVINTLINLDLQDITFEMGMWQLQDMI
jgi:hypothetical protein